MKPAYIYGLLEPGTQEIRYVGKTCHPQHRLGGHLLEIHRPGHRSKKAAWLRELDAAGLTPELVLIEEIQGDWKEAERRWIATCRNMGHRLTNRSPGGTGPEQSESPAPPPLKWFQPQPIKPASPTPPTPEQEGEA